MPSSFKGVRVGITSISIQHNSTGALASVDAVFTDNNGVVHGTVTHRINISETKDLLKPAEDLINALISYIEGKHYEDAESAPKKEAVVSGIAEAISERSNTLDGGEEQG